MMHSSPHSHAGQTVTLKHDIKDDVDELVGGAEFRIEDWWDRAAGVSWMYAEGNPACLKYAMRSGVAAHLPLDDKVVYGHLDNGLGHLVHVTELDLPQGGAS
jgi:hypothetical protein